VISIPWSGSGGTPSGSTWRTSPRTERLATLIAAGRTWLDGALAIVLAPACAACGRPLDRPTSGAVCSLCWNATAPTTSLGCCGFPPNVALATAIGPYADSLKAIVHALKYDRRSTIARHLARRMRAAGTEVLEGADAVVPVPLHRNRERARGFNQARELARHLGSPLLDCLVRVRATRPQADLPAAKRDGNVRGAFSLAPAVRVEGLVLVLVDDVSTTGATLNACAAPLLDAGAAEVRALTAARAVVRQR
jgi:ComF family protein